MEKIIWTLWWQGEKESPKVVKKCIESMRKHANGAEMVVLDQWNLNNYVKLPLRIEHLYKKGNISLTHLSDIVRFLLLEKYGGLWLDATVYVAEDISDDVFKIDFFSIKNGTGGDYKNIAQERWSAFIIGGNAGNPIFINMNKLFGDYWKVNDELICYFLIDFCLNEIYETDLECRKLINSVPDYAGNVFDMMSQFDSVDQMDKILIDGLFHKLNRKTIDNNTHSRKVKSFLRHIKELFCVRKWKKWGFKIAWITFLNNCTRTHHDAVSMFISHRYNEVMKNTLERMIN